LNRDKDAGTFTLDIDVWVSASKDSSTPSFKPTAPFLCKIPDSPRYKTCGRPVPYNRRFVSVSGVLSDVVYKDNKEPSHNNEDWEIERFVIMVDDIVFLGQAPQAASGASSPVLPNTLDGNNTPARKGFGFFKGGSALKRSADTALSSPAQLSTPTPATKRPRTQEAARPLTRSTSSGQQAPDNHDDIYA